MTPHITLAMSTNVYSCSCAYGNLFCTERDCDRDDDDDDDEEEEEDNDRDSTDDDRDSTDNDRDGSGDQDSTGGDRDSTDDDRDSTDDDRDGSGDDDDNPCDVCLKNPAQKVCGRSNGVTYPNKCFAVMCAGISPVDLIDEPCQYIVSQANNKYMQHSFSP